MTESIDRALTADPRNTSLWRELIFTSMHADLFVETLAIIRRARQAAGPHPIFQVNEAACLDETGNHETAWRLFESLSHFDDVSLLVRRLRNALRLGRPEQVAALAEPMLPGPHAMLVAPFLSIAWRMMDDPRWAWLEGDERLVGVYDLAEHLPSMESFAKRLRALHTTTHQPLDQSVRGGTQTGGNNLLSRIEPEIRALRRAIVEAVERHVAQLPAPDETHPILGVDRPAMIRFSGSWSIRLTEGGHHINHTHPQGWFSSAFYISLPDETEQTPDQSGWLALGEHDGEHGVKLPPTRVVEPKPGRLVLFPSTMWHKTRPFAAGERLTIAFDVAPSN